MRMIRHANRQLMGMVIIVLLLIAIFAVLLTSQSNSSQKESANQASDNNDNDDTSAEYMSEDNTTLATGTSSSSSARFMEEYGVPEQYIKEIYIEDTVGDELDFDFINSLKVYHAAPCYTENELIEKLLALCSKEDEDVSISKQSYQALSENALIGWGNYYRYADTDGNVFLKGGARSVSYTDFETAIGIQVSEDEQADFLEDFVSKYHLGIWKDTENFLQPFAKSQVEGGEEEYLAETFIDRLKLRYVSANIDEADADGAHYTGYGDLRAGFDDSGNLLYIEDMISAEVSEISELKYTYADMDALLENLYASWNAYASIEASIVYELSEASLVYSIGYCEDGTYILTPWLVLSGQIGLYMEETGKWSVFDEELYFNLSTGVAYGW